MGLFDGGTVPKGIEMMLVNLLKQAAPDLAANVDYMAQMVKDFKLQLDRIEATQKIMMERIIHDGRNTDTTCSTGGETATVD